MFDKFREIRAKKVSAYLIQKLGNEPKLILDLGSGNGDIGKKIQNSGHNVFGTDILIQSKRSISTVKYDGKILPFKNNSFDSVMLIWVLHHAKDPKSVLNEAKRVSRDKLIVMEVYYKTWFGKEFLKLVDYIENRPYNVQTPFAFRDLIGWISFFKRNNMFIEKMETGFKPHFLDPCKNVLFILKPQS